MIICKTTLSPQSFLDAVTGNCYILDYNNVLQEIKSILKANGYGSLRCLPLIKVATMLEKFAYAVLVEIPTDTGTDLYWFEVPENFKC